MPHLLHHSFPTRRPSDLDHEPLAQPPRAARAGYPAWLPAQALDTLALIERGGPYPHRQDGGTFQNRERLLPAQPRGYYREYTVRTPGSRDRGARRIVSGGSPPAEFFYTDDPYRSFRRFRSAEHTSELQSLMRNSYAVFC